MPFMRETGWAFCHGRKELGNGHTKPCFWGASGPNSWYAAVAHEEENPGHSVEVGTWGG